MTSRMNLRLSNELLDSIDIDRIKRHGNVSRNTWILEAISEKIARENSRVESFPYKKGFYEFFAGGGMARAGLGNHLKCLFANDIDSKKAASYAENWGNEDFRLEDVSKLTVDDLPFGGELTWASFPCQDLSLAGGGAGLKGDRSGTFWPFWSLMKDLREKNRAPKIVVLENVYGALTSHNGADFVAICKALSDGGYHFGAVVLDAIHFTPQSRPRLFLIAIDKKISLSPNLFSAKPDNNWHTKRLISAQDKLPKAASKDWVWWSLPEPPKRKQNFADILENKPKGVKWHTRAQTKTLLDMMSTVNLKKVDKARKTGKRKVGGIYKRTRMDEQGKKVQRAEIRFDDVAGCLRTPGGGSSRQIIMIVEGDHIRSRLLSPREAARLMGLPDDYILPERYNDAYHLVGDGLVVPVVRFLSTNLLEPILKTQTDIKKRIEIAA